MKSRILTLSLCLLLFCLSGCKKTCRCYRYDGGIVEFTQEELKDRDKSCAEMEEINLGKVYSLCENVIF